jgi:hypothetical protein
VQSALEALPSIGVGNVSVSGGAGGPYAVAFTGALAGQNVPQITVDASALTNPGNASASTTTHGSRASEVQELDLGAATGGTFTLTIGADATIALAFDATTSDVQAALEALPSIGAGNVSVAGGIGGPYTVTFAGALAGQDMTQITIDASALTRPGSATSATSANGASASEVQEVDLGSPSGGTFTLTLGPDTTGALSFDASAADVQAALESLPGIGAGNVTISGSDGGPYTVSFTGALAGIDESQITVDDTALTGGTGAVSNTLTDGGAVDEVQTVSLIATGGTFALIFGPDTTSALAFDATAADVQAALETLPSIGPTQSPSPAREAAATSPRPRLMPLA